jgi:Pilus assembly protein, PilO
VRPGKRIPPAAQYALAALAVLLIAGVGWFALVRPQKAELKTINADAAAAQQTLNDYRQRVAAARSAPRIDVADVYRLAAAMPEKPDMPDVLLQLSQLARDTGVRFDSITPQPLAAVGSYSAIPISVIFNGNFYNISDFLYRLRSLVSVHGGTLDATGRLFAIDTVTFDESPLQFPYIQATLLIDAFVYGDGGGVAAAAPVASTPTTTSGTTTSSTSTTGTTEGTPTTSTTSTTGTTGQNASAAGAP